MNSLSNSSANNVMKARFTAYLSTSLAHYKTYYLKKPKNQFL